MYGDVCVKRVLEAGIYRLVRNSLPASAAALGSSNNNCKAISYGWKVSRVQGIPGRLEKELFEWCGKFCALEC